MPGGFDKKGLCKLCKEPRTPDGHDPCIANLPGVVFACCGHGEKKGYIKFADGRCLDFKPIRMELDVPKYEVVQTGVPVRLKGEEYRVLYFEEGKVIIRHEKFSLDTVSIDVPVTYRENRKHTDHPNKE